MVLSLGGSESSARTKCRPCEGNGSPFLFFSLCDFEFVSGLMVLKWIIRVDTYEESTVLVDAFTAKKMVNAVVKTLSNCRNLGSFT